MKKRKRVWRFRIMAQEDRKALCVAFANSGYKVRCLEKQSSKPYHDSLYYVEVSK